MSLLVMPKQSADPDEMYSVLEIYYKINGWLSNKDLIEKLKLKLQNKLEPQAYTKKTQIPAYFGFIEWEDQKNSQSLRRITESGKRFFESLKNENKNLVFEELLFCLETLTFGKNALGVSSNSRIEPPQLFVKCILELGFITRKEFGYILNKLDKDEENFHFLLKKIYSNRKLKHINFKNIPNKFTDVKPITIMLKWGFFEVIGKIDNNEQITINKNFIDIYKTRLSALKIFNDNNNFENEDLSLINTLFENFKSLDKSFEKNYQTRLQELQTTDGKETKSQSRKEQSILRAILFKNKSEDKCAICHILLPTDLLVAAHIKPRHKCSLTERKNSHIVMPTCKLGCDDFFEKGYIIVNNNGVIIKNEKMNVSKQLNLILKNLEGKICTHFNTKTDIFFKYRQKMTSL